MATGTDSIGGAAIREAPATTRNQTLGKLYEFRPDSEELSTYMERVEIYFATNDVAEDKKVPVLLNAIGGDTYELLRSLVAPDSPMAKVNVKVSRYCANISSRNCRSSLSVFNSIGPFLPTSPNFYAWLHAAVFPMSSWTTRCVTTLCAGCTARTYRSICFLRRTSPCPREGSEFGDSASQHPGP